MNSEKLDQLHDLLEAFRSQIETVKDSEEQKDLTKAVNTLQAYLRGL